MEMGPTPVGRGADVERRCTAVATSRQNGLLGGHSGHRCTDVLHRPVSILSRRAVRAGRRLFNLVPDSFIAAPRAVGCGRNQRRTVSLAVRARTGPHPPE